MPGYFETLRTPLLAGRTFTEADNAPGRRLVIVDQMYADRNFPNQSAIGQRILLPGPGSRWAEVIGVVGHQRLFSLADPGRPTVYFTDGFWGIGVTRSWMVRTEGNPAQYAAAVVSCGGVPVLLPPTDSPAAADAVVARLDGLVISGGADVDPSRYGAEAHPRTAGWRPDRDAWESAVRELCDGATYREERYAERYAAMALTRHRHYRAFQDPATLALYRHLVVSGGWWDYVDSLASHNIGDLLVSHPAAIAPVLRDWAVDDDLWLRRTAVICQLHRKEQVDADLLRHALEANIEDSRHGREFFVRKAVGWALRQHARADQEWVRAFVAEHEDRLSSLSRREALKHL